MVMLGFCNSWVIWNKRWPTWDKQMTLSFRFFTLFNLQGHSGFHSLLQALTFLGLHPFLYRVLLEVAVFSMRRRPSCTTSPCRPGILQPAICYPLQDVTFTQCFGSACLLVPQWFVRDKGWFSSSVPLQWIVKSMRKGCQLQNKQKSLHYFSIYIWHVAKLHEQKANQE